MRPLDLLIVAFPLAGLALGSNAGGGKRPNIVLIMTDDQDLRLGSTDYQSVLQRELIQKGTEFTNHFTTTATCCPSRASLLRGQFAHNTNITHVVAPGGNYDKWVYSGLDEDYLPHWLKRAGYRVEYLGKLLNGYNTINYKPKPKGWDYINALTDPYTMQFNLQVMSENRGRPRVYNGFHQSDIIRAQSLDRLEYLTSKQDQPFFLTIAPTVPHKQDQPLTAAPPVPDERDQLLTVAPIMPHEQYDYFAPVPLARHKGQFPNATAPRYPNWNPADTFQQQKSNWMKTLPPLTDDWIKFGDWLFQQRVEAVQGVDELIEDVVKMLEAKGVMDNTYIIYTSDNGWHIGMGRCPAGKTLPYAEDTNLPFVVRGPDVPKGVKSTLPSTHIDLAPTLLELAGVAAADQPPQLEGRSLLAQWRRPQEGYEGQNTGTSRELLNVEYWGWGIFEAPIPKGGEPGIQLNNSYKSLRLVGSEHSWLFIKWCTNEVELYNTRDDPFELVNVARGGGNSTQKTNGTYGTSEDLEVQRLLSRLNAILLVTKSCTRNTCRDPWILLQPPNATAPITSLKAALDPAHDAFYASLPEMRFGECLGYQYAPNEVPFYPPESEQAIMQYRKPTDNFISPTPINLLPFDPTVLHGGPEQRNVSWAQILNASRELTDEELSGAGKRSLAGMDVFEGYA